VGGLVRGLFTRTPRPPQVDATVSTARSTSSRRPTWQATASAVPPASSISRATASTPSWRRLATATRAPASASASAIARPMPRLAPVTSARRPASRKRVSTMRGRLPEPREELVVQPTVRRRGLLAAQRVWPTGEVGHPPAGFLHDEPPGGEVPRLELPLPVGVEASACEV